jgi:nitrous oxidase accessory protein NosD
MKKVRIGKSFVLGIVLLFVGEAIITSTAENIQKPDLLFEKEEMLYVGGSGPNNYSKIQDAINASSDGDSIFVYDDSSPYHENLIVEKSITLTGEAKETTVIDGNKASYTGIICITADFVTIKGFYIRAEEDNNQAIFVSKVNDSSGKRDTLQNIQISENIIKADFIGIFLIRVNNAIIDKNYIEGCQFSGIVLDLSSHDIIRNNILCNNTNGIELFLERTPFFRLHFLQNRYGNNTITGNLITSNTVGIEINGGLGTLPTIIRRNNITDNKKGVSIKGGNTEISKNNFLNNQEHVHFTILTLLCFTNQYKENYWGKSTLTPVRINGEFSFIFFIPSYFSRLGIVIKEVQILQIPLISFDWHPGVKPYNISKEMKRGYE